MLSSPTNGIVMCRERRAWVHIVLMIGSDRERPRADRLDGLPDDGRTAVALLGQVAERIDIGTAVSSTRVSYVPDAFWLLPCSDAQDQRLGGY